MSRHEAHAIDTRQGNGASVSQFSNVLSWISEMYCGLHGHDNLLQFESDRMFLKCASCGHESNGWEITEPSRSQPVTADRPRRVVVRVRTPLMSSRRVA
jgi:hypothetical protein